MIKQRVGRHDGIDDPNVAVLTTRGGHVLLDQRPLIATSL